MSKKPLFLFFEVKFEGVTMSKKNTAELVSELLRPTVEEMGYILWDVEYSKIGTEYHLELTIDSAQRARPKGRMQEREAWQEERRERVKEAV